MAAAITATMMTMAPTTNQFLFLLRAAPPESPFVACRVPLAVRPSGPLFPVGFLEVQPWSSPVLWAVVVVALAVEDQHSMNL